MKRHPCSWLVLPLLLPGAVLGACVSSSGAHTTALVELYTSEGCSSCPPADRHLSQIWAGGASLERLVPLSLHVDYWDFIGWKDPYAQTVFTQRQRGLTRANGSSTVYTPHFFVSGLEVRRWQDGLAPQIAQTNRQPARAAITLHATKSAPAILKIEVSASAPPTTGALDLYVAVTESGLVHHVEDGENRGARLTHDQVVRTWIGPIPLVAGKLALQKEVSLASDWQLANIGVAAFVQSPNSGAVVQALGARGCAGP